MENVEVDVLVIGSGAGGLTAAITANEHGGDVLVVEKTDQYGGTSATSGGGIWIPCNHLMEGVGQSDTREAAMTYMKECIGDEVSEDRMAAFVDNAPKMLKFMEDKSHVKYITTPYSDYFPDKPGGKDGWRTLDPVPMNAAKLGDELANLRHPHPQTVFMGFTITIPEAQRLITKEKGYMWIIIKQWLSYKLDLPMRMKTKRHRRLTAGNALIGMCRRTMIERDIPIWLNSPMTSLIEADGKITGAIVERDGQKIKVTAKRGVILSAGGFESNPEMRAKHLKGPTDTKWSATPGTNTGDAHKAAADIGAKLTLMNGAWWGPSVQVPGTDRSMVMFAERSLPGVYIVNETGHRYLNEGSSYDVVGSQMQAHPETSWVVFDATARHKYAIGPLMPGSIKPDKKTSKRIMSVIHKADSLEELAKLINVDAQGLVETGKKVTAYAETGEDLDFRKGGTAYDRYYGDRTVTPNPCLGPLDKPPFYAFRATPGDIGTKGGVDVDVSARALSESGAPIAGLYAIGNTSASVMGHTYPGAGSTLGPAMTFGYVAARHIMGVNS